MMFPAHTIDIFPTPFSYAGSSVVATPWIDSNALVVIFFLDLTNGTDSIQGSVIDLNPDGTTNWQSSLHLFKAVTNLSGTATLEPGSYAFLVQPANASNAPAAPGCAAVSLGSDGTLALGGMLPDNTAISDSARISKEGLWPVYIVPSSYRGQGMIIGWQTNLSPLTPLFWVKPPLPGSYYPAGFSTELNMTGGSHLAPAGGPSYQIIFGEGSSGAGAALTNFLSVNTSKQFVPAGGAARLQVSLLASGLLTGTYFNGQTFPFKGVFISPGAGGGGFILGTNGQTESFQIPPQP
jgi:hypothetical protein